MGFIVDKKLFLNALQSVMPAVSNRSSLPVLSGVKITGADTRFALEATDLELVISLQASARGDGFSDYAVVPAKGLAKAVKSMPEDEVSIEIEAGDGRSRVEVTSGTRKVAIDGYSPDDWPEVRSDRKMQAVCWFDAEQLANALSRVVLCASSDEARPVLTGVQFTFGKDTLELAATDSYRLGYLKLETEQMGEVPEFAPIVPAKVLKALAKQLKKEKGRRGIIYVGSQGQDDSGPRLVEFSFGAVCWMARAIEGEFPNYRQLIPKETGGRLDFDAEEMISAAKGADAVRTQNSTPVRIVLGDSCELRMEESGTATVSETLKGASYSPNGVGPMLVAFNPSFLVDGVTFIGDERVRMWSADPYKPALFVNDDRSYVLMPVRLPG